jgi:hypothetical protein
MVAKRERSINSPELRRASSLFRVLSAPRLRGALESAIVEQMPALIVRDPPRLTVAQLDGLGIPSSRCSG